jgi:formate dehydrogenase subunit gamma
VGKYNAGQKLVFWLMSILIIILIGSGLVLWDQYFFSYTTIEQKRIAALVHSLAAIVIICVWIVHVYAAIWVRGTIRAMTRGSVTGGWAWRHHRKWLRELVLGKGEDKSSGTKPAE